MSLVLVRVVNTLPDAFPLLAAHAAEEGVRHMALLADHWRAGTQRFDDPGALFAAYIDGELAGIGGVTPQSDLAEPAMRMRRLYVAPAFRRQGVGQALAGAMIQQGLQAARLLTANARAGEAAPLFWEAMGFSPVEVTGHTHEMRG